MANLTSTFVINSKTMAVSELVDGKWVEQNFKLAGGKGTGMSTLIKVMASKGMKFNAKSVENKVTGTGKNAVTWTKASFDMGEAVKVTPKVVLTSEERAAKLADAKAKRDTVQAARKAVKAVDTCAPDDVCLEAF